jgi:hypothetical protein
MLPRPPNRDTVAPKVFSRQVLVRSAINKDQPVEVTEDVWHHGRFSHQVEVDQRTNTSEANSPGVNGWGSVITVQQMCQEMVKSDLQEAKRHALLKANGYAVNVSIE